MAGAVGFTGVNCFLKLFINGTPIGVLDVKSWSVKQSATLINDGVCGEVRDRLGKIVNYYDMKLSCYNVGLDKIGALLVDQANDDDGNSSTTKEFALVIKPKDGSKGGFTGTGCVIDDWELAVGGKTDRAMLEIPVRMQFFDKVAAI